MSHALKSPGDRVAWGRAIACVLLMGLLVGMTARAVRTARRGNDFGVYHAAARAVLAGEDIYETRSSRLGLPYLYPPTLAVLVVPLAPLPEVTSSLIWLGLLLVFLLTTLRVLTGLLPAGTRFTHLWMGGVSVLTLLWVVDSDLRNGQANLLVLFTIAIAAQLVASGRWRWAGVVVGIGAAIKVTPLIFAFYFVAKRRWDALLALGLGIVIAAGIIPALVMGPERAMAANDSWVRTKLLTATKGGEVVDLTRETYPPHQEGLSLRAIVYRWLTPSRITPEPTHATVNVMHLSHDTAEWVYRGFAVVLLGLALWAVGRSNPAGRPERVILEFALVAACMVLVSPLSRKAHFVALLPAVVCLLGEARGRNGRWAWALLAIVFVLVNLPDLLYPTPWRHVSLYTGSITAAGGLLCAALLIRAHRPTREPLRSQDKNSRFPVS